VSPEPKIIWQSLVSLNITKAVDDNDQTLAQGAVEIVPNAPPPQVGIAVQQARALGRIPPVPGIQYLGLHQEIPVYLKKGAKGSKSLKELSGVIQAQVLTPAKAVITTDDVFKAANKTFRGGENGWLKVVNATKADNGQVKVRFEMQAPMDVVPANAVLQPQNGPWNGPVPVPGIQIQPALPQGFQMQAAQPPQAAQPVQIQANARLVVLPAQQQVNAFGIVAQDDKGNAIPVTIQQQYVNDGVGGAHLEYAAIFQLQKGQEVARLVYSGSRNVTIEVPFTLKDVKLP